LDRFDPSRHFHEFRERVALDVEFNLWITLQKIGKVIHIRRPNMSAIRPGMNRNAMRASANAQFGGPQYAWYPDISRVSQ